MKLKPLASNMTEVTTSEYTVLFSYETPVACFQRTDYRYYRTSHKWSSTTTRHINKWLDGVKAKEQDQTFFDNLV